MDFSRGLTATILSSILFIRDCCGNNDSTSPSGSNDTKGGQMLDVYLTTGVIFGGVINPFLCIIGMICNTFNLIILTRRRLDTCLIFQGLAVADFMVLMIMCIFNLHFFAYHSPPAVSTAFIDKNTESYSWWLYYHTFFMPANLFLTSSNWCVMFLAIYCFFMASSPIKAQPWFTDIRLRGFIVLIYASALVLNIPDFATVDIAESNGTNPKIVPYGRLSKSMARVYITLKVVLNCLLPWLVCLVLMIWLSVKMRQGIISYSQPVVGVNNNNDSDAFENRRIEQKEMSRMLIIQMAGFLFCQFPSTLIFILNLSHETDGWAYFVFRILSDLGLIFNSAAKPLVYTLSFTFYRHVLHDLFCFWKLKEQVEGTGQNSNKMATVERHVSNAEQSTVM